MNTSDDELTAAFVEQQRARLEQLRDHYLRGTSRAEAENQDLGQHHRNEVQDSGDEGAIEAERTKVDVFSAKNTDRLDAIRRALEKIDEGTYGYSDDSGEPIGRARLEAVPEACHTVDEEAERESRPDL